MSRAGKPPARDFTMVPNCVLDGSVPGITPLMIAVYAVIRRYAFDGRSSWPGVKTIAANAGTSARTVKRAIRALVHAGLIDRGKRGRRMSREFIFLDGPLVAPLESQAGPSEASRGARSGTSRGHGWPPKKKILKKTCEEDVRATDAGVDLWDQILAAVQPKVNCRSFNTWLRPTRGLYLADGTLRVEVPNPLFTDWIGGNYLPLIQESAREVGHDGIVIRLTAKAGTEKTMAGASR